MSLLGELVSELEELLRKAALQPDSVWTEKASIWPVRIVSRKTEPDRIMTDGSSPSARPAMLQHHLVCAECPSEPSVICLSPDAELVGYQVSTSDILAGILAHIRRTHDT